MYMPFTETVKLLLLVFPSASVTSRVNVYFPSSVGVPESKALLPDDVTCRPGGNVPSTTCHVNGAVPPTTLTPLSEYVSSSIVDSVNLPLISRGRITTLHSLL